MPEILNILVKRTFSVVIELLFMISDYKSSNKFINKC